MSLKIVTLDFNRHKNGKPKLLLLRSWKNVELVFLMLECYDNVKVYTHHSLSEVVIVGFKQV